MIDKAFHTDRDVGEFIEGLRNSSHVRKRNGRARRMPDRGRTDKNAALLDMIKDMEDQLNALSSQATPAGHNHDQLESTLADQNRIKRTSERRAAVNRPAAPKTERADYQSVLERIQAQLERVDHALESKTGRNTANTDANRMLSGLKEGKTDRAASRRRAPKSNHEGLNTALRQIMEQAQNIEDAGIAAERGFGSHEPLPAHSLRDVAPSKQDTPVHDDSLALLREDVASLRDLLEEANFSGASERVLNEIAALSGRIDTLTGTMSETRQDPELMDAIRDIHALLDRPALDPSLDSHFDRVLVKLDNLPLNNHFEDFAKLSAQMDNLREILSAAPQAQHISHMSGQMGMLVERLGALENDVRRNATQTPLVDQRSEIEDRLSNLQTMMERLDPNDRLMRMEDQLASLADRLETTRDNGEVSRPLEALSLQMESLVGLMDQQGQHKQQDALEVLATRISDLDARIQENRMPAASDQRFDQVEQTLARIDDMLARRMESTDLSGLEVGLSRLADRIEAQEEVLRAQPASALNGAGQVDISGLTGLESQIADLADRLDGASRDGGDNAFFETLTTRLDNLAEQFAQSQTRFDAVDRIGSQIQQLASNGSGAPANQSKMAEAAALKALQKIGPLSASHGDAALENIIDALKDDLHGLRRFAESSESTTQESLSSVSSMLNTIVDRLGSLETEVRASEAPVTPKANFTDNLTPTVSTEEAEEPRGLGKLLRRKNKPTQTAAVEAENKPAAPAQGVQALSAAELLANRGNRASRRTVAQAQQPVDGTAASQAMTGQAPAVTAPQARGTQAAETTAQPQMRGNAALQSQPQPAAPPKPRTAQIVNSNGPARTAPTGEGASKADFIAAARRAAQAAAQESEQVEKNEKAAHGFLARLKNRSAEAPEAGVATPEAPAADAAGGMSRKERRAAISEAARKAKQIKDLDPADVAAGYDEQTGALASELLEDEETRQSLLAKLGSSVSRHSRPLLMAAAAILLAITTLQLAKNPNSSLHDLFNANTAQTEQGDLGTGLGADDKDNANSATSTPGDQSSLTPSSGNLGPAMVGEDATRAITFAKPSGAQTPMYGPRATQQPTMNGPRQIASLNQTQRTTPTGDAPGIGQGVDLTPTSSIPRAPLPNLEALQQEASQQPLPPLPTGQTSMSSDTGLGAPVIEGVVDPSVQAAIDMNKMLAPGISDSPLLKAAKAGDSLAQFEMGRRLTLGAGMAADLKEAATWFEKAATQSMPQAQYSLANLYEKGQGVKKDLQVARLWYQRAAEVGNVKAMHNLAVLFAEGGLGKPDFRQASHWFVKAADHGLKDSQYNLAILYARGMGIKQDLLQSYKWFAIAAKNGDKGAVSKRDEVLNALTPSQQKAAKSLVKNWVAKVGKPSANRLANLPDEWKIKAPAEVTASAAPGQQQVTKKQIILKTQSMLGALGYNAGVPDGKMGPRTRTAIRNFQEVAGLPVTGQIDEALFEALAQRVI